jgi:hypothetical protein
MPAENLAIWRTEQHAAHDELTQVLIPALDHMLAGLTAMGAGQTQRRLSARWPALMGDLAAEGQQVIDDHNPRLTRVSEAQSAAGGTAEVAANKRYSKK